jgi:glycerate dehydrogenase
MILRVGTIGAKAMHHIVFLERASLDAQVRRPAFEHTWAEHGKVAADQLADCLAGASIAIVNKTPLPGTLLEQLPALRMIAVAATGTDNVDIAACRVRGIVVSNIRNYAVHTVPEHAFALILALRRNLLAYRDDVARGLWQKSEQFCLSGHPIADLHGATIGIVGEGALGQGVARIARAFGMRVQFADHEPPKAPEVEFTPFDTVLRESDIVSLHLPLSPRTRNLIGARELALMKPGALLINTARGGLVDEAALAAALAAGTLAGAGFDVLSTEPPRAGNVLLELNLPNFILTPHVAWGSRGAMQLLADQLIDNVEAYAAGAPRNVVG